MDDKGLWIGEQGRKEKVHFASEVKTLKNTLKWSYARMLSLLRGPLWCVTA